MSHNLAIFSFSFLQKSDSNQFVSCGLAEKSMNQFSAKLKREKGACMKVKVELIRPYLSVYVVLVDFYLQYLIRSRLT